MRRIRLYVDEDAMNGLFIQGLIARNTDVVTANEANMVNREDEEHLMTATGLGRVLFSYNRGDYQRIHGEWLSQGGRTPGSLLPRNSGTRSANSSADSLAW